MEDYIDLVIAKLDEDHIVLRAPWNTVRAGDTVYVRGDGNYEALEVIAERKTKALMELPKVTAIMLPLEYDDEQSGGQKEKADLWTSRLEHRRRKKVKRLRYYIIYKDCREVKDKPCGKDKKRGLCSFFAPCSKYYF